MRKTLMAALAALLLSVVGTAQAVPITPTAPIFGATYQMLSLDPAPYEIGDVTYNGVTSPPPGSGLQDALSVYHIQFGLVGGGGVFEAEAICLDPPAEEDPNSPNYFVAIPLFSVVGSTISEEFGAILANDPDGTASDSARTMAAAQEVVLAPGNLDLLNGPLSYGGLDPNAIVNATADIVAADSNIITQPAGTTAVYMWPSTSTGVLLEPDLSHQPYGYLDGAQFVMEPGSLAIFATGLVGLGLVGFRWRRSA